MPARQCAPRRLARGQLSWPQTHAAIHWSRPPSGPPPSFLRDTAAAGCRPRRGERRVRFATGGAASPPRATAVEPSAGMPRRRRPCCRRRRRSKSKSSRRAPSERRTARAGVSSSRRAAVRGCEAHAATTWRRLRCVLPRRRAVARARVSAASASPPGEPRVPHARPQWSLEPSAGMPRRRRRRSKSKSSRRAPSERHTARARGSFSRRAAVRGYGAHAATTTRHHHGGSSSGGQLISLTHQ